MESVLNSLMDPGSMNSSQWLVLSLALFILIASAFFIYRIVKIFQSSGKTTYKPNIGLSRVDKRPPSDRGDV